MRRGREGGGERVEKDSSLPRSNNVWRLNSLTSGNGGINLVRGISNKNCFLQVSTMELHAATEMVVDI